MQSDDRVDTCLSDNKKMSTTLNLRIIDIPVIEEEWSHFYGPYEIFLNLHFSSLLLYIFLPSTWNRMWRITRAITGLSPKPRSLHSVP